MVFGTILANVMVNCSLNFCFDVRLLVLISLSLCSLELGNMNCVA